MYLLIFLHAVFCKVLKNLLIFVWYVELCISLRRITWFCVFYNIAEKLMIGALWKRKDPPFFFNQKNTFWDKINIESTLLTLYWYKNVATKTAYCVEKGIANAAHTLGQATLAFIWVYRINTIIDAFQLVGRTLSAYRSIIYQWKLRLFLRIMQKTAFKNVIKYSFYKALVLHTDFWNTL